MNFSKFIFLLILFCTSYLYAQPPDNLIGPVYPPPLGVYWSGSGNSGSTGGAVWNYQNISLANYDTVYWGPADNSILLSFNDSVFTVNEILQFNSILSNLTEGVLIWEGTTFFQTQPETVFTRFTLRVRNYGSGENLGIIPAETVALPINTGGVLWVISGLDFTANFIFEASFTRGSAYQPADEFYNEHEPGPATPYFSFNAGFYYFNSLPLLTANNILTVDEGHSVLLTPDYLSASDLESDSTHIYFSIAPENIGDAPHNGWLLRDDTPLQKGDSFTQSDLEQSRISYEHDGGESTWDNFTFDISDGDGATTPSGEFLTYTFNFIITPLNDPPQTLPGQAHVHANNTLSKSFSAFDADTPAQVLLFSLIENGKKGLAVLINDTTGLFSYTPYQNETGDDTIYFQVFDGIAFSNESGKFIITIDEIPVLPAGNILIGGYRESGPSQVLMINPETGTPSVYTNLFGDELKTNINIRDMVADEQGNLFVLTADTGLVRIDYITGQSSVLTPADSFTFPLTIDISAQRDIYVCDGTLGIVKINADNGQSSRFASGELLTFPAGIDIGPDGYLYVTDAEELGVPNGRVVKINPNTAEKTLVSSEVNLADPAGIITTADGIIYVADLNALGGSGHIVRIQPNDGSQEVISSGQLFVDPFGIDMFGGKLYVSDLNTQAILEVDTADGTQSIVFSDTTFKDLFGLYIIPSTISRLPLVTAADFPAEYVLLQNYPNPFNPGTTIRYTLSRPGWVKLDIFDLSGRKVETLVNKEQKLGAYSVIFYTRELASGIYIYCLSVNGQFLLPRKMILIK